MTICELFSNYQYSMVGEKPQWKPFIKSHILTLCSHYPSKITRKVGYFQGYLFLRLESQSESLLCSGFTSVIAVGCIAIVYIKCKFSNSEFSNSNLEKGNTETWAGQDIPLVLIIICNTKWLKTDDLAHINKFIFLQSVENHIV